MITVDLSLPGIDGISVIRELRERQNSSGILVLSAKGALEDKLLGFGVGADDYLPKPFAFDELVVRIRALARRRTNSIQDLKLSYSDLEMDLPARRVLRGGKEIKLTTQEFNLLRIIPSQPRTGTYARKDRGSRMARAIRARDQCDRGVYDVSAQKDRESKCSHVIANRAWCWIPSIRAA